MILIRFIEIVLKLSVCLSFKKYPIVRALILPLHLIFIPHLLVKKYHKRMVLALESLDGVFIKLGQSLSLKSFIFSKETVKALSYLQDSTPPEQIDIREYLKKNNPKLLNCVNFTIENTPIASASIAQVYKGTLNQIDVAIKVVKTNVKKQTEIDFRIIFFLVRIINVFCPPAIQIIDVVGEIYRNILSEINLQNEVKNLKLIKRNIIGDSNIHIPHIFDDFSNEFVIVMSYANGIPLRNVIHNDGVFNKKIIAQNIINTYLNQVYRDGAFHADMHAGNIFVNADNSITLIDFGTISVISREDRRAVATMIYGFLHNKSNLVLSAQLKAKYISDDVYFNNEYRNGIQKLTHNFQNKFEMSTFTQELFMLMNNFNVFVPKHLLLLNKTILYVEDVVKQLDSTFQPFNIINPWIKKWYYKEMLYIFAEKIRNLYN